MLRKYSSSRTASDNLKLGTLTGFSAGMVNVISVFVFFAFTSNVTGHYAVFAQEVSKGNWYQVAVVFMWILLFFLGSLVSNILVIHGKGRINQYLSHSIPLILEILSILFVGLYLEFKYEETLIEGEFLVGALLFAMGLQNGLTASISNSAIKSTHLTGLTTDLGILVSMFTIKKNRQDKDLVIKFNLLLSIMISYVIGGIFSGLCYIYFQNRTFYITCLVLMFIGLYDYYKLKAAKKIIDNLSKGDEEALRIIGSNILELSKEDKNKK